MRILGIDYGTRNIGVAVSDELGIGARGVTTLRDVRDEIAVERLAGLVAEWEAGAVVVGLPLRADGSSGDAARRVARFVERMKRTLTVPVHTIGERLTSFEAEERMRAMGMKPDERRRRVDEVAAIIILEEFVAARSGAEEQASDG
jgi:putative holliday junction resolvase